MKSKQAKILLIEDDPADQYLIKWALDLIFEKNLITLVANNGKEALEILNELEVDIQPDLILLDINMPVMDGKEFLGNIKQISLLRRIPVIVLTTSNHDRDIDDCYDLHISGYIQKPIDNDDLVSKLRTVKDYWYTTCFLSK